MFKRKNVPQVAPEKTLEENQAKLLEELSKFTQKSTSKIENIVKNLFELVVWEKKLTNDFTQNDFDKLQNKIHFKLDEIYSELTQITTDRFNVKTKFILIKNEEKKDGKHE